MSLLIKPDELLARRALVATSTDLKAVDEHLAADIARLLAKPLYVPEEKALLSRWGAHCRDDEAELEFDPFSPHAHRCSKCSRVWNTDQTHRWWIYWYQLWLAERVLMMALRSGSGGDAAAESRTLETLETIAARYLSWPNADNVLGPGRPFFSTYLESIWVLHLATAAATLESLGRLPRQLGADLRAKLFRPSADVIADFDEGRSNRQVWNAAAMFALGRVLGDATLAEKAATGSSGIVASLEGGMLADGLWYEGENYHWFALRGLTWGAELLRAAGTVDLWRDAGDAAGRFRAAFRAPVLTALPDFTFPARRDSKFGVSLRQRRMAELWEIDLARRATGDRNNVEVSASLLAHLYDASIPERDESWREITDVERAAPPSGVRRGHLGWKGWMWMVPERPAALPDAWRPGSAHLEDTGLAILRRDEGRTYISLDYGEPGGGHGHPDRLNLTAVMGGVPWLLDFGTGSYVAPSLSWYRMSLAHNAPLVDGASQAEAHGGCIAWEDDGSYGWICAFLPENTAYAGLTLQRTLVVTPSYVLDILQMQSSDVEHQVALPWHGLGKLTADEHGLLFARDEGSLRVHLTARQPFQVMVQRAPGPPPVTGGTTADLDFAATISTSEEVTLVACLDASGAVSEIECVEDGYIVRLRDGGLHTHRPTDDGWLIEPDQGDPISLGGLREVVETPLAAEPPPSGAHDIGRPLVLGRADQFRRAESPYEGPEAFSASAMLRLSDEAINVAVEVIAPGPQFRPAGTPNPEWENENPDIHGDGIQVYLDYAGYFGWLIVPDEQQDGQLRVMPVAGTDGEKEMIANGAWEPTPNGYALSFDIMVPEPPSEDFGFDLYVNRLGAGRERRGGQLVWSGARGSRLFLAGDRALPGPLPRISV